VISRREIPTETRAQQNIFVSMTDLTVSILLVVVILMAFMATQMRDTRLLGDLEALRGLLGAAEAQLAQRELERESQADALARIGGELALSEATRAELAGELASLRRDLRDKTAEAERLEGALLTAIKDGEALEATLRGELAASRAAQGEARADLERAERRALSLAGKLDALAREYEARGAELEGLATLNANLEAELDRRSAEGLELADLRARDVERLTAQLGALRDDLDKSARQLTETRDELRAEAAASKSLGLALAEREGELDASRRDLRARDAELAALTKAAAAAQAAHSEERETLLGEAARLTRELGAEAARRRAAQAQAETFTGIVGELRKSLAAERKKNQGAASTEDLAELERSLAGAQSALDAQKLKLESQAGELARLGARVEALTAEGAREREQLRGELARLGRDLDGEKLRRELAQGQLATLGGIVVELRGSLAAERRTSATLRNAAAEFDRRLAAALALKNPDRGLMLARAAELGAEADEVRAAEATPQRLDAALLEVDMLTEQNANLKATIQTLLANNAKIIQRLRGE
jgi:hypothetical protein